MNANSVVSHAQNLWPNARLTDQEVEAWRKSLSHLNVSTEQAHAVLDAVRVDRGRRSPPIAVINQRLRQIIESEARARDAAAPTCPEARLDYDRPQGMVVDAIKLWREDPAHPRWAQWRQRAVGSKTLEQQRSAWRKWTGQPGPYA